MALLDRIKFDSESADFVVWKYPSEEIRLGSQLVVNQSQEAVFFRGGKAFDVFGPGSYTLDSQNIPLLSKLVNLPYGGKTPFAAEIWFVNKTVRRGIKWGTRSPIPLIDPLYEYPVRVRAFGEWGYVVQDARTFLTRIVGTLRSFETSEIDEYFSAEVVQRFSDAVSKFLVKEKISIFQTNAHLNALADSVRRDLLEPLKGFGLEAASLNVERISIPEEEQKAFQEILGKKMAIREIGQVEVAKSYITQKTFDTLERAAENDGGSAASFLAGGVGAGIGLSAGVNLGQELGKALSPGPEDSKTDKATSVGEKLALLKQLFEQGTITQAEFESKKKEILSRL